MIVHGHHGTQSCATLPDHLAADEIGMIELVLVGRRKVGTVDLQLDPLQCHGLFARERRLAIEQHQLGHQPVALHAAAATPDDLGQDEGTGAPRQRRGRARGRSRCAGT